MTGRMKILDVAGELWDMGGDTMTDQEVWAYLDANRHWEIDDWSTEDTWANGDYFEWDIEPVDFPEIIALFHIWRDEDA